MAIKFSCLACGKRLSVKDEYAGRRSKCPECGQGITLPMESVWDSDHAPPSVADFKPPPVPAALTEIKTDENDDGDPAAWKPTKTVATESARTNRILLVGVAGGVLLAIGAIGFALRDETLPVAPGSERVAPARNPKIPVEVSYPVIDDVIGFSGTKRTVSVRLNIKVSEEVLREIALEVKAAENAQYEFTRIDFFLPGQRVGHGAWAMADCDSGLRVVIVGLTIEEERTYRTAPLELPAGSEPLGTWILESGFAKSRITIYRRNDRWYYHLQWAGTDKPGAIEMDELPAESGHVFKMHGSSDRYVIGATADLEIHNADGKLISRATLVVPPPPPR